MIRNPSFWAQMAPRDPWGQIMKKLRIHDLAPVDFPHDELDESCDADV